MNCSFVPPYLIGRLAAAGAGTPLARSGLQTLQLDRQLRQQRTAPPRLAFGAGLRMAGPDVARRVVHTAGQTEQLPGSVARSDGDGPTGDLAVDEAHDSSAQVWDLFADVFGRVSLDGTGTTLSVTVHYGVDYDNAFWDGSQLVFGDGDGEVFERFTRPMDVMAHEFAHGVTQFSAGLTYSGQSGALNESVSDVFAAMTRQRALGQDAEGADWLIGVGLFRPGVQARALRSMIEPGTAYDDPRLGRDPQVATMADYVEMTEDNGGVHVNSGIPNRAFALAAIAVGGRSWERTGQVWYDALTGGTVAADADFAAFAAATVSSATRLFADDPSVAAHVRGAWQQVGVLRPESAPAPSGPPSPPPLDVTAAGQARRVAVRRSGGMAGLVRSGELDLDEDPQGPQVRQLLQRADLSAVAEGPGPDHGGHADRFVYTVAVGEWQLTVPESDLGPELHQVVRIVLGSARRLDLG